MLGIDAPPQEVELLRHELWLDRPFLVQYGHWLGNVFRGDLGTSILYHQKVTELISESLPITAYLSILAFIFSNVVGILAGIVIATRRGSILDSVVTVIANFGVAVPIFWLGILGIYLFGLRLGWLPIYGFTWPWDNFWKSTGQVIMPVICLAIPGIAVMARQTRSSMLEVLNQDYIRTAVSKGLKERDVILKHGLKNALIPIVTLIGMQLRNLVGGSTLIETVFNINGMGRLLVNAAFTKDFLVVQGGVLLVSVTVCLANLLVDISYGWLDPRIRYE
jgi:peptide/nickel transport system permease protein